jgi:hypothetical protein
LLGDTGGGITVHSRRSNNEEDDSVHEQVVEVLQSLSEFHEGRWEGHAKSFKVTDDVAAGIVQRYTSAPYQVSTKLGLDVPNKDFTLSETWAWDDKISSRKVSLQSSNVDVDVDDGSYSLDQTLPDLPLEIIGSTTPLPQFLIEHCIAVSNDCRARCWAIYGVDQTLIRVVVTQEHRVKQNLDEESTGTTANGSTSMSDMTTADLLEMQSDVDQLVEKITGEGTSPSSSSKRSSNRTNLSAEGRLQELAKTTTNQEDNTDNGLSLHSASLLELSSGVWLGDIIIRDHPNVPITKEQRGQGFGTSKKSKPSSRRSTTDLAEWSIGVRKCVDTIGREAFRSRV